MMQMMGGENNTTSKHYTQRNTRNILYYSSSCSYTNNETINTTKIYLQNPKKALHNQQHLSRNTPIIIAKRRDDTTLWGGWAAADKVGLIPGGVSVGTRSPSGVMPLSGLRDGGVKGWGLNGTANFGKMNKIQYVWKISINISQIMTFR